MWGIAKGLLWFLDGFFNIIDGIWRYKFFDNEYVNKIFGGAIIVASSWLVLKVVLELIMNFIVKNDGKGSPLTIFKGTVLAIVMMFSITPLFQFGHDFSTALTDSVIEVSGIGNDSQENAISDALIRTMVYNEETKPDDKEYLVSNWKTIDINETEGGIVGVGDCYLYSLNFFMLIVLSFVTIFLLFFVAIQMGKRVMEIALFKIIAPFCCTSLTSGQSKSFETWTKSTMGLFLITVVQFVCLGLLINMFGTAIQDNGTLTGIFLIIGALLFIISTPTIVSSLLGQQSGMMTAFGDIQSLMALGQGVSSGMGLAKAGTMSALSMGTNVIGGGISKGGGMASNMFKKKNSLTEEQMTQVKESISNHNPHKAFQQVQDGLTQNKNKGKSNNIMNMTNSNPFTQPFNMRYNPMRNQYMSQSGLEANSNFDRKWY
ncbi:MAG: hypothetical protein E7166_00750 [Firmicutes bacterium]|nr:hypothetical protein [Bacillota bacterium]